MWEQQFGLIYNSNGGITYGDVLQMDRKERDWFVIKLSKQIKEENEALSKNNKSSPKKTKLPSGKGRSQRRK